MTDFVSRYVQKFEAPDVTSFKIQICWNSIKLLTYFDKAGIFEEGCISVKLIQYIDAGRDWPGVGQGSVT